MARFAATSVAVSLLTLFLFTLSHARDVQHSFPLSKPEPENPKPQPRDTVSLTLEAIDPVPLTLVSFRPINRHVQRPLPLSLRHGLRRCRHAHRREIPYGNDAIDRHIPAQWARVRSNEARFPEMLDQHEHEHHHHHHHHRHGHEVGWFAKKIRKFMNLF